jgi:hypothetical protein
MPGSVYLLQQSTFPNLLQILLLFNICCRCVLDPGDKIVDCPPTFTMYEFDAAVNGALVIKGT